VTEQSEHLSSAQIENYGNRTSGAGPEAAQRDEHQRANHQSSDGKSLFDQRIDQQVTDQSASDQRVEAHLADCASCRNRLLDFHRHRFALLSGPAPDARPTDSALADSKFANSKYPADPQVRTAPTPECPSDDALRQLAASLTPEDAAPALTRHAATCDYCGPLLRTYTEIFSDDFTPEEQAALANLKSSSAEWQKNTARQMLQAAGASAAEDASTAGASAAEADNSSAAAADKLDQKLSAGRQVSPAPVRKPFFWKWALVPASAAVVAVAAFSIWYTQRDTSEKVEKLLAQAYTEQRTMEMRWPGAEWGPPRVTRGPGESRFSKPAPLIKAEAVIEDYQSARPDSLKWLRAKAHAEILEGHPESAINLLGPARNADPDSIPLMFDLSLAYSQQWEDSHDPKNYATVLDLLERILKKEPGNRAALFNLAITYSNGEMWDEATATLEAYLRIDPDGPWAQEAKEKLAFAKTKLHATVQELPSPATDAGLFLTLTNDEVASRSEQYQEIALQNWLTSAIANPRSPEYFAVSRLAQIESHTNSDLWLQDFLDRSSARDPSGIAALSAAFAANTKGHYAEAIKASEQAKKLFRKEKNFPGELRARYESVYASQRLLHGTDCLARADPLQKTVVLTTYHWLQSQLAIERAICLNFISSLSGIDSELSYSLTVAKQFHLPIIALRNIGISQSIDIQEGKYDTAWLSGIRGLKDYWAGPPSVQRLYQFYVGMALASEHMGLWAAADTLQNHAIDILGKQQDGDRIQRGAALLELANILIAEKLDASAEAKLIEANKLFDYESLEPTSRSYRLVARVGLAELQLKRGKLNEAFSSLEPAQELLSKTDGYFVSLHYYQLMGTINLRLGCLEQAAEGYKAAIVIAELSLNEIKRSQDRLQWVKATDEAYRGLVRVFLEEHNAADGFRLWEWYQSRASQESSMTAVRIQKPSLASWPDIWRAASTVSWQAEPAVRIVYAVFNDGVQIWMPSKGELRATWVGMSREQLEQLVQRFSHACAQPNSPLSEVHKQGQDLFSLLVQPVIDQIPVGSVIAIEMDRSLANIPFEALRSPDGWYLAERYPVIYSAGIIREKHLRNPEAVNAKKLLLLADESVAGGQGYLPGSERERETISRLFPKTKIIGPEATLAETQTLLAESDIFSFIGHSEPNNTGTALRVSPRLLLKAQDFPPHILHRLQIAVLAACATASGGENGLLDNRNLVHAFLAGGVPTVIASNWNVDSTATAELMQAFYAHVAKGQPASIAAFTARNETLKVHNHPYFWSGFSLVGKAIQ
jgi:CHAT domain-containing protein